MGFIETEYTKSDATLTIICDKCGIYMYFNQMRDKKDNNTANFGLYLCPECAKDVFLNNHNYKGSSTVQ